MRTDAAAVGCARDNRAISATTVTSATMPKDFTATSNSTPVCAEFVEARQMLFNNNNNSNNNPICKAPKCQKTSVALGVALTLLHFTVDVCNGNANSRPLHKYSGPGYPLCRLYHGRAPIRRQGAPADQLPNLYHAVLTFERSVYA